ncbi:MAG: hypothetical protein C4K49_09540 [Candidatus Thorarchaeota archaeon]|nr:MAG: hypothetical protein C4K49_09540 [Candidatus Thorarchaeota archaeon]
MLSQVTSELFLILYGVPALLIGLLAGYSFGGHKSLTRAERLGFGLVICVLSGLVMTFLLAPFAPVAMPNVLVQVLSFSFGYVFGAFNNWAPIESRAPKRHVVFEPEDDDEFDKEVDKALGSNR